MLSKKVGSLPVVGTVLAHPLSEGILVIILGVVLLVLGLLVHGLHILFVIGGILLVVGVVLALLGAGGRAIGGRRHYY